MLLFLMIPVSLLAFTVAIGPVLVMTVVEHHARTRTARSGVPVDDVRPVATPPVPDAVRRDEPVRHDGDGLHDGDEHHARTRRLVGAR